MNDADKIPPQVSALETRRSGNHGAGDAASPNEAPPARLKTIIFPGIDHILFTRRHREEITKLKLKGDYRNKSVKYALKLFFFADALMLSAAVFIYTYSHDARGLYWLFAHYLVPIGLVVASLSLPLMLRRIEWLLPTIGQLTDGEITKTYSRVSSMGLGWDITFSYKDQRGQTHSRKITMAKRHFGRKTPRPGDKVYTFVDPLNPSKAKMYIPVDFARTCDSKSRYEELKRLPFLRGNDQWESLYPRYPHGDGRAAKARVQG